MNNKIKIGIVTTINHNIGDDFVRVGIQNILKNFIDENRIQYILVNKHNPLTVLSPCNPVRYTRLVTRLFTKGRRVLENILFFISPKFNIFSSCDIIIQSGAPVIFDRCSKTEWSYMLWRSTLKKLSNKIPILNIAAGSCFSYTNKDKINLSENDIKFLKEIGNLCSLFTVRDPLAFKIMNELGINAPLIPCTAFLSGMAHKSSANQESPILINYMELSGHYDFDGRIDCKRHLEKFKTMLSKLAMKNTLIIVAHSEEEFLFYKKEFSTFKLVWPKSVDEYYEIAKGVKFGITNRLHCAVVLAGLGIKSYSIGNDTRLLMLKEIGLKYCDVNEFHVEDVIGYVEKSLAEEIISPNFISLRNEVFESYKTIIKPIISNLECI